MEGNRLTIGNWIDARNDVWVDPARLAEIDEVERQHFNHMKVIYQFGKGLVLVLFLVPTDTVPALNKLCDLDIRSQCDIAPNNPYLFPSTHQMLLTEFV